MIATDLFLLLLIPLLSSAQIPQPDDDLHVYALPVGQGDATVIQCPEQFGGSLVVVDMGSTKYNGFMDKDSVRAWLNGWQVDAIFLTHPDKGHFNMMNAIGANISNGLPIYHTCEASEYDEVSMDMVEWNANLNRIGQCVADDLNCSFAAGLPPCPNYRICQGEALIRILAAELNGCAGGGENYDSMVVKLEYRGKSALLLGDLEDKNDNPTPTDGHPYNILLECADVSSHLMRLAHHGAYGKANKDALLSRINPTYVFSSSGFNKQFRHPRCEIFGFFYEWLQNPQGTSVNLAESKNLPHRYTCGGPKQKNKLPWVSSNIIQGIYSTSVCDVSFDNRAQLRNYVIALTVASSTGQLNVNLAQFSAYTSDQYPPGNNLFPC